MSMEPNKLTLWVWEEWDVVSIEIKDYMLCALGPQLHHLCLKIIPTRPLRHVWPEVVMENHTHTPAVHGKSHCERCPTFEKSF